MTASSGTGIKPLRFCIAGTGVSLDRSNRTTRCRTLAGTHAAARGPGGVRAQAGRCNSAGAVSMAALAAGAVFGIITVVGLLFYGSGQRIIVPYCWRRFCHRYWRWPPPCNPRAGSPALAATATALNRRRHLAQLQF